MLTTIDIKFIIDPTCPWCYVGKRRLEAAISMRNQYNYKISFVPFFLNPNFPIGGLDRQEYLSRKFSDSRIIENMLHNLKEIGQKENIKFQFSRIKRQSQAVLPMALAHHIAALDQDGFVTQKLIEDIMHGFFVAGMDIGNQEYLENLWQAAVREHNFSYIPFSEIIATSFHAVAKNYDSVQQIGVKSVPMYVFNDEITISGAIEPNNFIPIFDLLALKS